MAIMELESIVEGLSHTHKTDLLRYLIQDIGLSESVRIMQSYAMNGNGVHKPEEEQFPDLLSWFDEELYRAIDPKEEEENRIMAQESEAYQQMHSELLDKYTGQYVVIHQGELVDWDMDKVALMERVYENYSQTTVLVRQVLPEMMPTIKIPSSRMKYVYD